MSIKSDENKKSCLRILLEILPVILIIIGWPIVYYLDSARDKENKRNEMVVQYLIETSKYLVDLNRVGHLSLNENLTEQEKKELIEAWRNFEKAMFNMQLLGSNVQIDKVFEIYKIFEKAREEKSQKIAFDTTELLLNFRDELREYLGLDKVKDRKRGFAWIGITNFLKSLFKETNVNKDEAEKPVKQIKRK
ncbi:MAG TPA: hypothetical protein ACFYD7_07945 [Candidatus Wujingus californicus]|uniref:hypothetical protein n=1 Tax=Candidatus Wujingus californicus TaxID=3367618 RepID=UPI001DE9AA12|nr:hypothetical protein [Planctomycetota bacterium]MDO8132105.1 hypothetical protein [Candidatus Brocadiales bacterium]